MKVLVFFAFVWGIVMPKPVYAYLDPGSGSLLIQLLLGAVLGGIYFVKLYWGKLIKFIFSFFGNKTDEKKNTK